MATSGWKGRGKVGAVGDGRDARWVGGGGGGIVGMGGEGMDVQSRSGQRQGQPTVEWRGTEGNYLVSGEI